MMKAKRQLRNHSKSSLQAEGPRYELMGGSMENLPWGFPGGSEGKSICLQCRSPGFDPWVRKIPWRRKWQPTPVLLPGQRSLVGESPWGRKELDLTKRLHFHFQVSISVELNTFAFFATKLQNFFHLATYQLCTHSTTILPFSFHCSTFSKSEHSRCLISVESNFIYPFLSGLFCLVECVLDSSML